MFRKTKAALTAAIVLGTALSASAAPRHYRVHRADPAIYNALPGALPGATCSPVRPPLCSNICTGPDPCAPPDSW